MSFEIAHNPADPPAPEDHAAELAPFVEANVGEVEKRLTEAGATPEHLSAFAQIREWVKEQLHLAYRDKGASGTYVGVVGHDDGTLGARVTWRTKEGETGTDTAGVIGPPTPEPEEVHDVSVSSAMSSLLDTLPGGSTTETGIVGAGEIVLPPGVELPTEGETTPLAPESDSSPAADAATDQGDE